jgi:Glycosyl hydrolases family 31 TIM-barrel domain
MKINFTEKEYINIVQELCVRVGEKTRNLVLDDNTQAEDNELLFVRDIEELESGYSVSLSFINNSPDAVCLETMTALDMKDFVDSVLPDISDMQVFRLSRQKNDIPGIFSPAKQDASMEDALFSSAEIKAGGGIGWEDFGSDKELPRQFEADPAMIFMDSDNGMALLVGFTGQTRHLNRISLVSNDARDQIIELQATALFDGVTVAPGESRESHELLLLYGTDLQDLLEQYAGIIAEKHGFDQPDSQKKLSVFCTWYFYGADFHEGDLDENLAALKQNKVPFDVFQIDHCWMENFGDFEPNLERFPNGMKSVAKKLRDAGFIPGIWTCPFVMEQQSEVAKKYPDIILRDRDGNPCLFNCQAGPCYTLDPFAPNAEKYIIELFQRLRSWGYDYHKLDFLRAVFIHDNAVYCDPSKNRAEAYRKALELVRQGLGDDAILVTCGGLFEGSVGLSDINRSGADVQGHWKHGDKRLASYTIRIKQILARNFYNRFWHCDPDALQLRRRTESFRGNEKKKHLAMGLLNDEEAFSTVVYQFINGGIACASEKLMDIDEDRRLMYKYVMPQYAGPAQWLDWQGYLPEEMVTNFDNPDNGLDPYKVLTIANWSDDPVVKTVKLSDVPQLNNSTTAVFEFKEQKFYGLCGADDAIKVELPPHSCRVFRLSKWSGEKVVLLGTDLNLAMGMELDKVRCRKDFIAGSSNTPWDLPFTVTVAFPAANGECVVRKAQMSTQQKNFKLDND